MRHLTTLTLLLLAGACAADGGGVCQPKAVASVEYTFRNNRVLLPVSVNGKPLFMMVDTGMQISSLTKASAANLGLNPDLNHPWNVVAPSGSTVTWKAPVKSLAVGDQVWHDQSLLLVNGSTPADTQIGGLFGADLLSRFDVELDPVSRRLTFWSVGNCRGDFLPWTENHAVIPMKRIIDGKRKIQVTIGGRQINAEIDLGAQTSAITSVAAARLGIAQDKLDGDRTIPTRGVGGAQWDSKRHAFPAISIGSESIDKPTMLVGAVFLTGADMLLSADYLAHRHIWISYSTDQLFIVPQKKSVVARSGS